MGASLVSPFLRCQTGVKCSHLSSHHEKYGSDDGELSVALQEWSIEIHMLLDAVFLDMPACEDHADTAWARFKSILRFTKLQIVKLFSLLRIILASN